MFHVKQEITMLNILAVGAGGFIGSTLRYLIGLIPLKAETDFPYKTFTINILGCFIIGLIAAMAGKKNLDPRLILFLKVGICGGFTTFSSFALESTDLIHAGHPAIAALYCILSVSVGIIAVIAAQVIAG